MNDQDFYSLFEPDPDEVSPFYQSTFKGPKKPSQPGFPGSSGESRNPHFGGPGSKSALLNPSSTLEDKESGEDPDEASMRPKIWDEFFGQSKIKENLDIYIQAANQRGEALDHVLLYGPPGLGKTTLSRLIAARLGVNFRITTGPAIERQGDLAAILSNLKARDVLFIDEIHRLNRSIEEILYPAMEDYALDIMLGKGPSAKSVRLDLAPFTLIGATTRAGMLSAPLRDRFGVIHRLDLYTPEELYHIVERNAEVLGLHAEPEALQMIASRSRGTPRIAIRILRRMRDFAEVKAKGRLTQEVGQLAMSALDIDALGLDTSDRRLLTTMAQHFGGGPVGLQTLAFATGEDADTIEDFYEPFLMQSGLISRTPRGRILTKKALEYLQLNPQEYNYLSKETGIGGLPGKPGQGKQPETPAQEPGPSIFDLAAPSQKDPAPPDPNTGL